MNKHRNIKDPKGFFRQPFSCLAGESCISRRLIAEKTFRVSLQEDIE